MEEAFEKVPFYYISCKIVSWIRNHIFDAIKEKKKKRIVFLTAFVFHVAVLRDSLFKRKSSSSLSPFLSRVSSKYYLTKVSHSLQSYATALIFHELSFNKYGNTSVVVKSKVSFQKSSRDFFFKILFYKNVVILAIALIFHLCDYLCQIIYYKSRTLNLED